MTNKITSFGLLVLALLSVVLAAEEKRITLSDIKIHPRWDVSESTVDPNSEFTFNVFLKQQNLDVLEKNFWEVSDPKHANYGKFWTRNDIDNLIRPKEESFQSVQSWLETQLPKDSRIARGAAFISVSTKAGDASRLFNTELRSWTHKNGVQRIRAFGEASVPSGIDQHVHLFTGLYDFIVPHQNLNVVPEENNSTLQSKRSKRGDPYVPYDKAFTVTPSSIATLYNVGSTSVTDGRTTQGVLAFDDFYQNGALNLFYNTYSISGAKSVSNAGTITSSTNFIESNLDTQYMVGLSPGANPFFVAIGKTAWILEALEIALPEASKTPQVITISYSSPESQVCLGSYSLCGGTDASNSKSYLDRSDSEFQKLGLMGVTVMAASGDNGVSHWSNGFCPIDTSIYCPNGGCTYTSSQCQSAVATFSDGQIVYPIGFASPSKYFQGWLSDNSRCNLRLDGPSDDPTSLLYSTCTCDQLTYGTYDRIKISQYVPNDPSLYFTAEWPASSPYITGVGGTQVQSGGAEVASSQLTGSRIASGGGFSAYYTAPSYQSAAVSAWVSGSSTKPVAGAYDSTKRGFPDISAVAHNYQVVVCPSANTQSGCKSSSVDGTSGSSPVMAGLITLINDALIKSGKSTVGFLNPVLYQAFSDSPTSFKDITSGTNRCHTLFCCTEGYTATTGWDPVTGVGVPNFTNLKNYIITAKANTVYNTALDSNFVPLTRRSSNTSAKLQTGFLVLALLSVFVL